MDTDRQSTSPEVFISYSSKDRDRVLEVARQLEMAGVMLWIDETQIEGGQSHGPLIVQGIRDCKVFAVMCSNNSMRSRDVGQEIRLAWSLQRLYLPLLLDRISYPDQVRYWLEGWQWIEILDHPPEDWVPRVLQALHRAGVHSFASGPAADSGPGVSLPAATASTRPPTLEGLRAVAAYTDLIWPISASRAPLDLTRGTTVPMRGLGAPQDDLQRTFRLGDQVCLAIESEGPGYLLLLDEGAEDIIYCLCPSRFAPEPRLGKGRTYLPQAPSPFPAFQVSGKPGREELLAIITHEPLGLDWMPTEPRIPTRVLTESDVGTLISRLRDLDPQQWIALSTYFNVIS